MSKIRAKLRFFHNQKLFDREYVVRRGLRSDFVVVVLDHQELLYKIVITLFLVISGREEKH